MSSWALSPRRTFLNDANRCRFQTTRDPPFENNATSPGPAAYTPKKVALPSVKGSVRYSQVDHTEREVTLSDGKLVSKILPMGPGEYNTTGGTNRLPSPSKLGKIGTGPRFAPPRTDQEKYSAELPGPGAYSPPDPQLAATGGHFTTTPREVCLPLRKEGDESPDLKGSMRSSSRSPPSTVVKPLPLDETPLISPRNKIKGCAIPISPRHFNLHNINSPGARDRDPDYDNPPPGRYNPKLESISPTKKGVFSVSPRKLDMSNNNHVPGPGAYGGDTFNPTI